MAANPALASGAPQSPITPQTASEALPIPAKWRALQLVLLALIGGAALFYYLTVWQRINGANRALSDFFGFVVLGGLVWAATPTAATIATSTLQEALRRRWLVGFLAFSMVAIFCSAWLTFLQLGEEQRFLQDFGTGFIIGMTLLIAIFLGVTLVPPEIERRTIFTILSKPVNRLEFLVGKYLGLCLTLLFCLVTLATFFIVVFIVFNLRDKGWTAWTTGTAALPEATLGFQTAQLVKAFVLHFGQLAVMGALSLMLSLIVTPITAITFCFLAFFGGQMSSYWSELGQGAKAGTSRGLDGAMQGIIKVVYYVLPRMDHFDARQKLVTDTAISSVEVWKAWSSGLVYIAVLLIIGYLIFSDREF